MLLTNEKIVLKRLLLDLMDIEISSEWTEWKTEPCIAPCNGVGIQIQSRKCFSKNIVGQSIGRSKKCLGMDKNVKSCYGKACSVSQNNQIVVNDQITFKAEPGPSPTESSQAPCCEFNGQNYQAGDVIKADLLVSVFCDLGCNIHTELNEGIFKSRKNSCFPVSPKCGKAPAWRVKKIVGGSQTQPHSHPWSVMIKKSEGTRIFVCGATVICKRWLMTAAHCIAHQSYFSPVYDLNPKDYQLYFGRHYGATYQPMPQTEERSGIAHIEKIEVHPNFNQGTIMYNDIALIKVAVQTGAISDCYYRNHSVLRQSFIR